MPFDSITLTFLHVMASCGETFWFCLVPSNTMTLPKCILQVVIWQLWDFLIHDFFSLRFYVYGYFCLHVSLVTAEVRREHRIPWIWSHRQLWAILRVLGPESGSSLRAARSLSCCTISLSPPSVIRVSQSHSPSVFSLLLLCRLRLLEQHWVDLKKAIFPLLLFLSGEFSRFHY